MSDQQQIQQGLRQYIATELLRGKAEGLDEQSPLLEWGVIDSLSLVGLIAFIEKQFGVRLTEADVTPNHFQNLASITALVTKRGSAPRS